MRAEVGAKDDRTPWWPYTLPFLGHFNNPFEIFARSVSKTYFDRARVLLAISTPDDLAALIKSYQDGSRKLPRCDGEGFSPEALLGYTQLATRP